MEDAGFAPDEIKGVVLVGGSTRVPAVRSAVGELFGRDPLGDIDPDAVVALGAALQAEALTVGLRYPVARCHAFVARSRHHGRLGGERSSIATRRFRSARAQEFTTYQDGQTGMIIHVLQGEREMVDQNRSLAKFELTGIPSMVAGAARIRVTFAVDADGLLTVTAREETTGTESKVEVKPSYGLGEARSNACCTTA